MYWIQDGRGLQKAQSRQMKSSILFFYNAMVILKQDKMYKQWSFQLTVLIIYRLTSSSDPTQLYSLELGKFFSPLALKTRTWHILGESLFHSWHTCPPETKFECYYIQTILKSDVKSLFISYQKCILKCILKILLKKNTKIRKG